MGNSLQTMSEEDEDAVQILRANTRVLEIDFQEILGVD